MAKAKSPSPVEAGPPSLVLHQAEDAAVVVGSEAVGVEGVGVEVEDRERLLAVGIGDAEHGDFHDAVDALRRVMRENLAWRDERHPDDIAAALPDILPHTPIPIIADIHFDHRLALAALKAGMAPKATALRDGEFAAVDAAEAPEGATAVVVIDESALDDALDLARKAAGVL